MLCRITLINLYSHLVKSHFQPHKWEFLERSCQHVDLIALQLVSFPRQWFSISIILWFFFWKTGGMLRKDIPSRESSVRKKNKTLAPFSLDFSVFGYFNLNNLNEYNVNLQVILHWECTIFSPEGINFHDILIIFTATDACAINRGLK